ncbi:MAG: type II toxin-antitoxin system RelE/ParE family toxin [Candidatus Nitrosotenuis sp.]
MAYNIFLTDFAKKQLAKLDKQIAKRITKKLHEISNDPFLYVSKLVGQDLYKLRVGDYRVLLTIQQDKLIIIVVEVRHRRNVYK